MQIENKIAILELIDDKDIGRYKDTVINTPDDWRILERNLTAG